MRAGRFIGDGDDNALARFRAALAADPDNADAKAGLGRVAQALIVQANAALDSEDDVQATRLLDQAAKPAPKSAELAAARARIGGGEAKAGTPAAGGQPTGDDAMPEASMAVTPEQKAKVADLVRRAQAAASRGDIMDPPGDSAYDLYCNALAIDGNDASARAGLQGLPTQVEKQMQQAEASGNAQRAENLYATLSDLAPGGTSQADLRHRLGSAWIDNASSGPDKATVRALSRRWTTRAATRPTIRVCRARTSASRPAVEWWHEGSRHRWFGPDRPVPASLARRRGCGYPRGQPAATGRSSMAHGRAAGCDAGIALARRRGQPRAARLPRVVVFGDPPGGYAACHRHLADERRDQARF